MLHSYFQAKLHKPAIIFIDEIDAIIGAIRAEHVAYTKLESFSLYSMSVMFFFKF